MHVTEENEDRELSASMNCFGKISEYNRKEKSRLFICLLNQLCCLGDFSTNEIRLGCCLPAPAIVSQGTNPLHLLAAHKAANKDRGSG
ncbi:hypothetical protein AVEN_20423-1 [Araneus ventricosus]|uniref:Uncharacterized protein n=1 Tax=Araneus ventricosus TaxID=182803 RepID=A0A4Y2K6S4_ARAVE|nr:hypothetical protein AVEN_20423-1 [Araneus ventricosus]